MKRCYHLLTVFGCLVWMTRAFASEGHWAWKPPEWRPIPTVVDASWVRGPIDAFILNKLESRGLTPAPSASPEILLRRIWLDVLGLPPTEEALKAMQVSTEADPWVKVVDALLASPHYGERWGRHWLDVARYGDSNGGDENHAYPHAYRYRNWVMESLDRDIRFDRFLQAQLAGDLLPRGETESLAGTGFLAIGTKILAEQDPIKKQADTIDEQLDTIGKAFLGLTVGCARCHDHKFDPIDSADYYGMAGILKSTKFVIHSNVSTWNQRPLPVSPDEKRLNEERSNRIKNLQKEIAHLKKSDRKRTKSAVPISSLSGIVVDDLDARRIGEWTSSTSNSGYVASNYLHDGAARKGEKEVRYSARIPGDGKFEVRISYTPGTNRDRRVPVLIRHADGETTKHVDQTRDPPLDGSFISLGIYDFLAGDGEVVIISTKGTTAHVIADAVQLIPEGTTASKKAVPLPDETTARKDKLKSLEARLKLLRDEGSSSPMVIAAEESSNPSDIPIAIRGNVHESGPTAPRGFIKILQTSPTPSIAPGSSGRRELADWISSPRNPLTARVFVNRVWYHLFGRGIVKSVDNFGQMGDDPSHPELLDYLSSRFIAEGWSIKSLVRRIMMSRPYQLSSFSAPTQTPRRQ